MKGLYTLLLITMLFLVSSCSASEDKRSDDGYTEYRKPSKTENDLFRNTYFCNLRLTPVKVKSKKWGVTCSYIYLCKDLKGRKYEVVVSQVPKNKGGAHFLFFRPVETYKEIVDFIKKGYRTHWKRINPEKMGLSSVLLYESPNIGYQIYDVNFDGISDLVIGEKIGDRWVLYNCFTVNEKTGDLLSIFVGGERDTFEMYTCSCIKETGSNSAEDSFEKIYQMQGQKLVEIPALIQDKIMHFNLQNFIEE